MSTEPKDDDRPEHLWKIRAVAQRLVEVFGSAALDRALNMEQVSKNRIIARSVRVEIERILKSH